MCWNAMDCWKTPWKQWVLHLAKATLLVNTLLEWPFPIKSFIHSRRGGSPCGASGKREGRQLGLVQPQAKTNPGNSRLNVPSAWEKTQCAKPCDICLLSRVFSVNSFYVLYFLLLILLLLSYLTALSCKLFLSQPQLWLLHFQLQREEVSKQCDFRGSILNSGIPLRNPDTVPHVSPKANVHLQ